ncbi:cadherin-like domain-containing protein [Thiofilum flexile]|uniref:cadherin-like domain-containing protein n=1 Tax=Thiofilum flexile TaxID=125627 RepID=UPI000360C75D|nr:cadherin-like domain-containing protein [Thiofilum flexile]
MDSYSKNPKTNLASSALVTICAILLVPKALAEVNPKNLELPPKHSSTPTFRAAAATAGTDYAIISNGTIQLGVNNTGNLNVPGAVSAGGTPYVGLRYVPTNNDSTSPGCLCEGWGVADKVSGVTGYANQDAGTDGLTVESFTSTGTTATSVVTIGSTFRVTHEYSPTSLTPNLYEVKVTIENISASEVEVLYRRNMDWDVEPTAFNEYVTVKTNKLPNVVFTSNNGFASSNPLAGPSDIGYTGEFTDAGPADYGALFDFNFGKLAASQSKTFTIYYGATPDETSALVALDTVDAVQTYSLGQPSSSLPTDGTPNTFIFAFKNVGGIVDTDGDALPDEWEKLASIGGMNWNEASFGENPNNGLPDVNRKDVYLWVDILPPPIITKDGVDQYAYTPFSDQAIRRVQKAFALHGVNLHVYVNRVTLSRLQESGLSRSAFLSDNTPNVLDPDNITINDNIKAGLKEYKEKFGFSSLKTPNQENTRDSIYHYALVGAKFYDKTTALPWSGIALSENNAIFISAGINLWSESMQAGTLMHELGHNLGLGHGGPWFKFTNGVIVVENNGTPKYKDNFDDVNSFNNKPNYLSIMNYAFQFSGLNVGKEDYKFDYASFNIGDINENTVLFTNGTDNDVSKRWFTDITHGPIVPEAMKSIVYGTNIACGYTDSDDSEEGKGKGKQPAFLVQKNDIANYKSDQVVYSFNNKDEYCYNILNSDHNSDHERDKILGSYSDWPEIAYQYGTIGNGIGLIPGIDKPDFSDSYAIEEKNQEPSIEELHYTQSYNVSVSTKDFERSLNSTNDKILHQFTVTNMGLLADTYDLNTWSDKGFTVNLLGDSVLNLAPGESKLVTLEITAPATALENDTDHITFKAKGRAYETVDSKEVWITLTNSAPIDSDGDRLDNDAESAIKTDPNNPDTDGDGLLDGFDPNPLVADTTIVNSFTIPTKFNNDPDTLVESDAVTITGPSINVPIYILQGEYSIDGGEFTKLPGEIKSGQTIVVRLQSSTTAGAFKSTLVNIGGQTAEFKVHTFDVNNHTPVAQNDSISTHTNTPVTISNILANDTDADNDSLTITTFDTSSTQGGKVVSNSDGTLTYTPKTDFVGNDSFNYTISDDRGGTATATVSITVEKANTYPIAKADSATTKQNIAVITSNVLSNDTDTDGDTLTVSTFDATSAQGGKVVNNGNGTFTYTPKTDFVGSDSFNYTVSDGKGGTATAQVTITVQASSRGDGSGSSSGGGGSTDLLAVFGLFFLMLLRFFKRK